MPDAQVVAEHAAEVDRSRIMTVVCHLVAASVADVRTNRKEELRFATS
jgi:hypothetical protein